MGSGAIPPAHAGHGWLAALVPADARSFRVVDPALEQALRFAGAELVEERPDVEIGPADAIRGDARYAVVVVAEERPEGSFRPLRAALRAARSRRALRGASLAARGLRARGYEQVSTIPWALDRPFPLPGQGAPAVGLPVWALVVGGPGGARGPTILESVAAAAGVQLEQLPNVRQGVVVAVTRQGVLRVAVGPAERQIAEQTHALARLRELGPGSLAVERAPAILGSGRVGFALWSLEERLPGKAPGAVTGNLRGECTRLLEELFGLGSAAAGPGPRERAGVVAAACDPAEARRLDELGARLAESNDTVPRGFAHGDFWSENLLADGEALAGVVDWDHGGEGRLPLADLFHLLVNEVRRQRRIGIGQAVADWLLPLSRQGGDAEVRSFCSRVGLDAEPRLLTDLALAYWLDYVARQLELYADRSARPVWMRDNVSRVLNAASPAAGPAARLG